MAIWCLGTIRYRRDGVIQGYCLADCENTVKKKDDSGREYDAAQIKYVSEGVLKNVMAKNGIKIENLEYKNGAVAFSSGTENTYPVFSSRNYGIIGYGKDDTDVLMYNGQLMFPFIVIGKAPDVNGIIAVLTSGRIVKAPEPAFIADVEQKGRKLCNAVVVSDGGKKYIRSKRGELEQTNLLNSQKPNNVVTNNVQAQPVVNKPQVQQPVQPKPVVQQQPVQQVQKPVVQQAPVQKPVTPPAPPVAATNQYTDRVFVYDTLPNGEEYIKGVRLADGKMFIETFKNLSFPVMHNGKTVRFIEATALDVDIDEATHKTNMETYEVLELMLNGTPIDNSAKTGFAVVDMNNSFSAVSTVRPGFIRVRYVESWENNNNSRIRVVIVPCKINYTKGGETVAQFDSCTVHQFCGPRAFKFGANIEVITEHTFDDYQFGQLQLDLRQSKIQFITSEMCKNAIELRKVYFNNLVTTIHDSAFQNCYKLRTVLPKSLTSIKKQSFYKCNLGKIQFEPGMQLKSIGASAFEGCWLDRMSELNIDFVDGSIATKAFKDITKDSKDKVKFTGIKVGKTVSRVGDLAFSVNVDDPNDRPVLIFENGVEEVGAISYGAFSRIVIPNSVKKLMDTNSKHLMYKADLAEYMNNSTNGISPFVTVVEIDKSSAVYPQVLAIKRVADGLDVKYNADDTKQGAAVIEIAATGEDDENMARMKRVFSIYKNDETALKNMFLSNRNNRTPFTIEELLAR